ncbi:MAG: sulfite exporter TauE/SafE family protein [Deltaproteobacteria bacterium]|nr:sulfite exporter TauE/SafE family protein [Deltaproteobacteria bacterium]
MLLLGLLISVGIGVSLGLIGGGGSVIAVPVLVYVLGVDPHQAIGMSLAVVGMASFIGMLAYARKGTVDGKTGVVFGGAGVLGASVGSQLTYLVASSTLMLLFAGVMIVIAGVMLVRKPQMEQERERSPVRLVNAIGIGMAVGALTGFLGVGGGFLIVPALLFFGGLDMKEAVGTSLLVIAINCTAGLLGHWHHGGFDVLLTFLVTAVAVTGALFGARLADKVSLSRLRASFAVVVFGVAVFLLVKNSLV